MIILTKNNKFYWHLFKCIFFTYVTVTLYACQQRVKNIDHPVYFDSVLKHADSLFTLAEKGRPIKFIDSVYNNYPNPGIGDVYRKYAFKRRYFYDKDYAIAMVYVDSILLILKDHSKDNAYKKLYENAILQKGDILQAQKRFAEAFQYYYQAKQIGEKSGDSLFVSDYLGQLGMVCYRQGKYLEAVSYFKKCVEILHTADKNDFLVFSSLQGNTDNIALSYDRAHIFDSAYHYYNQALNYIRNNENRFNGDSSHRRFIGTAKGVIYGNLAYANYRLEDYSTAEALLKESININLQPGYENLDAQFMQLKLAALYLKMNRPTECKAILLTVKDYIDANMMSDNDLNMRWLKMQERYYDKINNTDSGYKYLKAYTTAKDSMDAQNHALHELDVNSELENVARQHEIIALKSDDRFKSVLLFICVLFLGSVITIAFLIWKNWNRSKHNLQLVAVQNERLTAALRAVEDRDQENAALLKVIVHDLKNPVGNISAIAGLLLEDEHAPTPDKSMYRMIQTASGQAFGIINQLLESKNKGELKDLRTELTDIPVLLTECIDLLQFKALKKKQRIKVGKFPPGLAMLDRDKIWQLFTNLIDNAIKFSPDKSAISIHVTRNTNTYTIMIKDNGIGIPDTLKEKVFEMHTEAGRTGTSGEKSFGLGLSISRKIVEIHKGKLWFKSEQEKGTVFYIELPCLPVTETVASNI
ncbi:Signal transduction histidine kinase [Chitinophaga sp. CF118]|uniref:tetratricopeptide repeat-containing sensor histidine kinase n=1 Tax=Chitinophaga sp. CF118 TaxID=1884367 RepID=UPI0008E085F1|nr:ATP-binding protein [Chitinophaga sp. CF118]SFE06310.1 Signal transduction histidine kinase [Chitinophaga sp. CF118]